MNENDLFRAYQSVADEAEKSGKMPPRVARVQAGSEKCVVESCPTMIALYTGRVMCLFHVGKRKRGEM